MAEYPYFVYVTINHPKGEMEYSQEAGDLDSVMAEVVKRYPSATSVVMSIVLRRNVQ